MQVTTLIRRSRAAKAVALACGVAALGAASGTTIVSALPTTTHYHPGVDPAGTPPSNPARAGSPTPDARHSDSPTQCSGGPSAGTTALKAYVDYWYDGTSDGIYNCRNVRGGSSLSLHAEGRALDWHLNSAVAAEKAQGDKLVAAMLASDESGNKWALARRFGLQEIIWNKRIWTSARASEGLRAYSGADLHTTHVHLGQNRAAANKQTSAYTGYTATDGCSCYASFDLAGGIDDPTFVDPAD
jgi:hypothetical protein